MSALATVTGAALLFFGSLFCLIGALGLLRMPDFISRVHAASLIDSLGVILILAGLAMQAGFSLVTVKLVMILIFLLLTGPTAIHALVNTALHEEAGLLSQKEPPSNT